MTDAIKEKIGKKNKDRIIVHNSEHEKHIFQEELQTYLDNGYVLGILNRNRSSSVKGKIVINNGIKNKYVTEDELDYYLQNGYVKGPKPYKRNMPKHWTESHKANLSKSLKGRICIHKDNKNKYIREEDLLYYLSEG